MIKPIREAIRQLVQQHRRQGLANPERAVATITVDMYYNYYYNTLLTIAIEVTAHLPKILNVRISYSINDPLIETSWRTV
jgi:hypothetical protein